ncbi:hypothetical protein K438DRAFT_1773037 [Mycena galopus ATCC 62051]|nr:hypothetical protein K438DRAFT_1773037 [Mycena galopus ATCC 62051]
MWGACGTSGGRTLRAQLVGEGEEDEMEVDEEDPAMATGATPGPAGESEDEDKGHEAREQAVSGLLYQISMLALDDGICGDADDEACLRLIGSNIRSISAAYFAAWGQLPDLPLTGVVHVPAGAIVRIQDHSITGAEAVKDLSTTGLKEQRWKVFPYTWWRGAGGE